MCVCEFLSVSECEFCESVCVSVCACEWMDVCVLCYLFVFDMLSVHIMFNAP